MALSEELAEELTCPIDLEFYIEPMSLRCLHTLCKKDVEHLLNEDDLIVCPVCQKVSQKGDIKHDFKTQRLLDLHTADKDRLTTQLLCENCEDEIALTWCEQCHGYFGEKCGKGHMKFKTTMHHTLIKISTIREENKSIIDSAIETINDVSDSINSLRKDCSEHVSKLDRIYKDGIDQIGASEEMIISVVRSSHAKLRENLECDFNKRKQVIEELNSHLQLIENNNEKERKLLEDCINEKDQKTIYDKRIIQDLTRQSRQKCEQLTKELTQINPSTQDISVSISNPDKIVQGIESITVEIKECYSTKKQNNELPQACTRPKTKKSTQQDKAKDNPSLEASDTPKIPTLVDYTTGEVKVQKLKLQLPIDCKRIYSIATINESVWLVMEDGSVNIMRIDENDTLSFQKRMRISHQPTLIMRKAVQGPERKIIAGFEIKTETPAFIKQIASIETTSMWHLYEIADKELRHIDSNTIIDIAADDTHVYTLFCSTIRIYQYFDSDWKHILNVSLYDDVNSFCAYKQLITAVSPYDVIIKNDLRANKQLFVEQLASHIFLCDRTGNVLMGDADNKCITVLCKDNSTKKVNLCKNREVNFVSAALDYQGRILALHNDGTVYRLASE